MSEPKNNLDDLRSHLFDTMRGLKDGSVSIDVARATNEVAKTLVETAKVEVAYLEITGGGESEFIPTVGNDNLPDGITGIRRHLIRG